MQRIKTRLFVRRVHPIKDIKLSGEIILTACKSRVDDNCIFICPPFLGGIFYWEEKHMEFFMSIAVAVLFLAMGCLAGIFLGALATVRTLQTRYPQTWCTFLMESGKQK